MVLMANRGRRKDGQTEGRTSGYSPLCSTGHRPCGAAAQKGRKKEDMEGSKAAKEERKEGREKERREGRNGETGGRKQGS